MKGGGRSGRSSYSKYTEPVTKQGLGVGGGKATTDSCATIKFNAQLQRVQPAISTVVAGDELEVQNIRADIRVLNDTGAVVGYVASIYNSKLIECIKRGFNYKAVVNSITGRICKVTVLIAS